MDINKLVTTAKDLVGKNKKFIDKGADAIDKATQGKYSGKIEKGRDAAKNAADKFAPDQNGGGHTSPR